MSAAYKFIATPPGAHPNPHLPAPPGSLHLRRSTLLAPPRMTAVQPMAVSQVWLYLTELCLSHVMLLPQHWHTTDAACLQPVFGARRSEHSDIHHLPGRHVKLEASSGQPVYCILMAAHTYEFGE